MDYHIDPALEVEEQLKNIIRKYIPDDYDDNEEDVQKLHDELISQLKDWGIDVYP